MLKILTSDKALPLSCIALPSFNLVASWHCVCIGKEGVFGTGSAMGESLA